MYNYDVITEHSYGNVTWYDLTSPLPNEVEKLALVYKLDPLVKEELLTPTFKPKVDSYDNCLYIILHFPVTSKNGKNTNKEIDFVIGEDFLITTHYGSNANYHPLEKFPDVFPSRGFLDVSTKRMHAGHVFFHMIHDLYQSALIDLESLSEVLMKAERNLFKKKEKSMLITLSKINRDLLDYKIATNLHRSVLESFDRESVSFFGKEYSSYTKEILNEYYKINASIQESKEFLEELRRTNDSLLSNKQNEIMKTISVLAFIFLPLSLLASIFGMNIENMPIVSSPHSWSIIVGVMIVVGLLIALIARYKEWL